MDPDFMQWPSYTHTDGQTYDLSHLHPKSLLYVRPAKNNLPEERYSVRLHFTSHCFTRGRRSLADGLLYELDGEFRTFDPQRYALSLHLPDILAGLGGSRVQTNSRQGKFLVVRCANSQGQQVDYEIYFRLRKIARGQPLDLLVESAFVRDESGAKNRPNGKPVSFWIALHNTLHGKTLRF